MNNNNRPKRASNYLSFSSDEGIKKRFATDFQSLRTISKSSTIFLIFLIIILLFLMHYSVENFVFSKETTFSNPQDAEILSLYQSKKEFQRQIDYNQQLIKDSVEKISKAQEELDDLMGKYNRTWEMLNLKIKNLNPELRLNINNLEKEEEKGNLINPFDLLNQNQLKLEPKELNINLDQGDNNNNNNNNKKEGLVGDIEVRQEVLPSPDIQPEPQQKPSDPENDARREAVKQGILHAWNAYKKHAWGKDELKPISQSFQQWLNLGATIIDALDTLIITGLKEEATEAIEWIRGNLNFEQDTTAPTFETTIRVLGGLLSGYELSGERILLEKAEDLGARLLRSFRDSVPFPFGTVNLLNGNTGYIGWAGGNHILSEIGTMQLEFLYLAMKSNRTEFAKKILQVYKTLDEMPKDDGLYYLFLTSQGTWGSSTSSLGGLGDSFYEYLIKIWIMTGKSVPGYRRMYDSALDPIKRRMVTKAPNSLTFLFELHNGVPQTKMEHLACFAGGMFALGAKNEEELQLGADITNTCHQMYDSTATKLGPESISFNGDGSFFPNSRYYILRPETIESYFVLWRQTHDQKYRDWGWEAFQAIEKYCKIPSGGYSGIRDVMNSGPGNHDDLQQTFLLAETFKYLFLLFSDDDVIPLDKYVFNTEAHPLGVFENVVWPEDIANVFPSP